jgi:hypothetical protein
MKVLLNEFGVVLFGQEVGLLFGKLVVEGKLVVVVFGCCMVFGGRL